MKAEWIGGTLEESTWLYNALFCLTFRAQIIQPSVYSSDSERQFVCLQQWQATLVRVIIRSPQEHPKQCDHWSGQVQSGQVGGQSYQTGWSPVGSCSRSLPAPARDEMIWIEIFKCHSLIKVSYVWQERKMIRKQSNMYISKNPLMTTNKFQFIKSNYQRTCDLVSLLSGLEEDPVWRFPNPEANGTGSFINPLFSSVFAWTCTW